MDMVSSSLQAGPFTARSARLTSGIIQTASGGFKGSTYMDTPNPTTSPAHLPSTYTALLCLALLRAPLDRLNIPGLLCFLKSCQAEDGSFSPLQAEPYLLEGFQSDARMAYIASVISHIIQDPSGINMPKLKDWIRTCRVSINCRETTQALTSKRPGRAATLPDLEGLRPRAGRPIALWQPFPSCPTLINPHHL